MSQMANEPPTTTYCLCKTTDVSRFMIECDFCKDWFHGDCLDPRIKQEQADHYEKFYCPNCEAIKGPSVYRPPTRKSGRSKATINYNEVEVVGGVNVAAIDEFKWSKILASRKFAASTSFHRLNGHELTKEWVERSGMKRPVIIENPEGLGMQMPPSSLTVSDVADSCGRDRTVDVLEVSTQSERIMTLHQWATYFALPSAERPRILNVITLEISESSLGKQVVRPKLVRDIDWIDHVWPAEVRAKEYPKVQLYCLMSVKDSYTDFHIDFGGSSVFYHLLSGQKTFYFIEPNDKNLKKYETWSSSPDQAMHFFADQVKECIKVDLVAGNTMIIPTGWIHAVYTPADSVVIGGNFLHGYNIPGQLRIFEIEKRTFVPAKFRFPYFETMLWYSSRHYLKIIRETPLVLSPWELRGLSRLCDHLEVVGYNLTNISRVNKEERLRIKKTIPEGLKNVQKLVRKLKERIKAERKRCKTASALTGDNDINDDDDGVEDNAEDGREGITEVSSGDAPPKPPPNPSQPIKLHLTLNSSSSSSSSVHSSPKATSMVTAINNNPTTGVANGDMKIKLFVVKEVLMSSSPASVNRSITYEDSDDWDSDMTEMEILDSEDPDDVVADVDDDSDVERGEEAAVSGGGDDDDDEKEWNSRKKRRTGSNTKDTSSITAGNKLSIPNTTKSALASTTSSSATMIKIIPTSSLITASTNNNNNAPMISKLKLNVGSLETPLTYNINWARKEEDENEEAGSDSSESDSGDEESASVDEEDGDGDVEEDDSAARQSFPKIRLKVTAQASIPSRQRSPVKKKRKLSSRYNNNNDVWTVRNHSVSTKPRPEQPITNNTDNANIPESNSVDNLQKTATAATSTTSSSSSLDQMFSFSPLPASSKPAAVVSKSTIVAQSHCPPGSDAALQRKKASKGKVFSKLLKTLKR